MRNSVVVLVMKSTGRMSVYKTVIQLMQKNKTNGLGICLNALYNALARYKRYENNKCEIFYKRKEDFKCRTWS